MRLVPRCKHDKGLGIGEFNCGVVRRLMEIEWLDGCAGGDISRDWDEQATPPVGAEQPAVLQNAFPAGELAFLSGYAGRTTKNLMKDKQSRRLKLLSPQ